MSFWQTTRPLKSEKAKKILASESLKGKLIIAIKKLNDEKEAKFIDGDNNVITLHRVKELNVDANLHELTR